MSALQIFDPLYSLSGFGVGALVGLTGVGGGSLMTPLLILLFGVHPATAVGTDLLYASVTKMAGTAVHGKGGTVDWRITVRLAIGSIPAAAITLLAWRLTGGQGQSHAGLISGFIGAALIMTALSLLLRPWITQRAAARMSRLQPRMVELLTIATGAVLGVLVTISSVGAGAIGMTALVLLYPNLPPARLVGSDIAHAVPLTLLAGFGHFLLGGIDPALLLHLLTGSIPGVIIGSLLARRVPAMVLRPILAGTLILVGGRLLA